MEKVICWGTGSYYRGHCRTIKELEAEGKVKVLALVNREGKGVLDGYPIISKAEIKEYRFDRIIITAEAETTNILADIRELGIPEEKIVNFPRYTKFIGYEYQNTVVRKQVNVLKKILAASDEEVCSYDWMYHIIHEYGIYPFSWEGKREEYWTEYGVLQVPEEFAEYCCFIGGLTGIERAIEIGVAKGRSSYFMCALLSRKNPGLTYTLVDIQDSLDFFECFRDILPALEKKIPSTSDDYADEIYDFVFIDGDHSYDASMLDYINIGQYAKKVTCFHDVYAHEYDAYSGGIVRTWKAVLEMTKDKQHKVFSTYPGKWMGIGCVLYEDA